jgi:hypothetical protein
VIFDPKGEDQARYYGFAGPEILHKVFGAQHAQ